MRAPFFAKAFSIRTLSAHERILAECSIKS